jgi:hypothetical protein
MPSKSYKGESRKEWVKLTLTESECLNHSDLQLGAILRIADAIEKMAQRHIDLIDRAEYLKGYNDRLIKSNETLTRSNNALRGIIKSKKKAKP